MLDKITKYISLLTIIILFLTLIGLYSLSSYYEHFDITIFDYLEPTEILLLFAVDLKAIFWVTLSIALSYLIPETFFKKQFIKFIRKPLSKIEAFTEWVKKSDEAIVKNELEQIKKEQRFLSAKYKTFHSRMGLMFYSVILLFVVINILIILSYFNSQRVEQSTNNFYIIYIGLMLMLGAFLVGQFPNLTKLTLFLEFLAFIYLFDLKSQLAYQNLFNEPKYSITLRTDVNNIISTNDSILFIGSTKNYYFFTNKKTKENRIVPKSVVVDELQRKLRGGF